jgi:hypothetical protein
MKQHRTPEQWKAVIVEYERSGLSPEQFCTQAGFSTRSLSKWRRKIKASSLAPASEPAGFVEVCLPKRSEVGVASEESEPSLVVELPFGVILKFRGTGQK